MCYGDGVPLAPPIELAGCVGFPGVSAQVESRVASMRVPLPLAAGADVTPPEA